MIKYAFDGKTRVALLPALANIGAPTLAEIAGGSDVSCDLTPGGLRLAAATESLPGSPWKGDRSLQRAGHYGFPNAMLEGFRFAPPLDEPLWDLAVFRARMWMVTRSGVDYGQAWAEDDVVKCYEFRFGKRSDADSNPDTLVTFTVPLFISDDSDSAVVAA